MMIVFQFLAACQPTATSLPTATEPAKVEPTPTTKPISTNTPTIISTNTSNISKTPETVETTTPTDCTNGWTRLRINVYARVAGAENDPPNRVRLEPVKSDNTIAQIYPGTIVKVIEGPVCADGLVFWKVENATIPNGSGWTAEGDNNGYWLEPYVYIPESVQLSNFGVTIFVPGSWSSVPDAEIVGSGSSDWSWCKWPEHIKITLTSYPAESGWKPILYVYRTSDQPDWYPICPGAPLLRIREKMLQHGSRLLFGSTNAQPIFNSELVYSYKGLAPDGKHTIFAFFPVNYPFLAYSFQNLTLPLGGIPFDLINQDWEHYYQEVGKQLEAAKDEDFTPDLKLLDTIMESITVTRP